MLRGLAQDLADLCPARNETGFSFSAFDCWTSTVHFLFMYSAAVLDHFKNPRNAGDLPDATAAVRSETKQAFHSLLSTVGLRRYTFSSCIPLPFLTISKIHATRATCRMRPLRSTSPILFAVTL